MPQFPHPFGSDNAYASPRQPPPPPPAPDHYDNPSPPAADPLQRGAAERVAVSSAADLGLNNLTRQSFEKEPRSAAHEFGRFGTPGNDRELKLLPSPIIRHGSRASVKGHVDSTGSVCDNSDNIVDDRESSETANPADLHSAGIGGNGGNTAGTVL
jgi:hypothetical protein